MGVAPLAETFGVCARGQRLPSVLPLFRFEWCEPGANSIVIHAVYADWTAASSLTLYFLWNNDTLLHASNPSDIDAASLSKDRILTLYREAHVLALSQTDTCFKWCQQLGRVHLFFELGHFLVELIHVRKQGVVAVVCCLEHFYELIYVLHIMYSIIIDYLCILLVYQDNKSPA